MHAQIVTTIAGKLDVAGTQDGAALGQATFNNPHGIANDKHGNVYIVDRWSHTIRKLDTQTGIVSTIAGTGSPGDVDGHVSIASFREPWGIAADSSGRFLYIADTKNHKIRKIDTQTGFVTTVAGTGQAGVVNGPGIVARFSSPTGITVAPDGTLYVCDHLAHTIRKIQPNGFVTTLAGQAFVNGTADGQGNAARFHRPYGIELDQEGNIIVADEWNHLIRKVSPTGMVTTIAGSGTLGHDNGPALQATFNFPWDVVADNDGAIYIMDGWNHLIRKLEDGQVSNFAGKALTSGGTDGLGENARFNGATAISLNPHTGIFYIGDAFNNLIRQVEKIPRLEIEAENPDGSPIASGDTLCVGTQVKFTAMPQRFFNYQFFLDGSLVQNSASPLYHHTFNETGTYRLKVVGTGQFGMVSESEEFVVQVAEMPQAGIAVQSMNITASGMEVQFEGSPPGAALYRWDFGDPASGAANYSSLLNPLHTYASYGSYSVQLIVSNGGACRDTLLRQDLISYQAIGLAAAPYLSGDTLCVGTSVELAAVPDSFDTYTFFLNGNEVQSGTAATYHASFSSPGWQEMTVTGHKGTVDTESGVFRLYLTAPPTTGFTHSILGENNEGLQVAFTADPPAAVSYQWNFGDPASGPANTSALPNPTHTYSQLGTYDVSLVASNGGFCRDTLTKASLIFYQRIALQSAEVASGDTICAGTSLQFRAAPRIFDTYTFLLNGVEQQQNTTGDWEHLFTQAGSQVLTVRGSDSLGHSVSSRDFLLYVQSIPQAAISFEVLQANQEHMEVQFRGLPQGAGRYLWDFGDPASGSQNTSSLETPVHVYEAFGEYEVSLIVQNAQCADTTSRLLVYQPLGVASELLQPGDTICAGQSYRFRAQPGMYETYEFFLNGVSLQQGPADSIEITFTQAGVQQLSVSGTDSSGTVVQSAMFPLFVSAPPSAAFTAEVTSQSLESMVVQFEATGEALSYLWDFGDPASGAENTSTLARPIHTYTRFGLYDVQLIASNGGWCEDTLMRQRAIEFRPLRLEAASGQTLLLQGDTLCVGSEVHFNALPIAYQQYVFYLNGQLVQEGPQAVWQHQFGQEGSYQLKVLARDEQGELIGQDSLQLVVMPQAIASISYEAVEVNASGLLVQFAADPPPAVSYLWDFGDPASGEHNTSTLPNPTHVYAFPGAYHVSLRVSNGGACHDSLRLDSLIVFEEVMLAAEGYKQGDTLCTDTEVSFLASPAHFQAYEFYLNGSLAQKSVSPLFRTHFAQQGLQQVEIVATDANGLRLRSESFSLYAVDRPLASFSITPLQTTPAGYEVQFESNTTATYYYWDFGDPASGAANHSSLSNPRHIYQEFGEYDVRLLVSNGGQCTDSLLEAAAVAYIYDDGNLFVPSAFTPNGDGLNDVLYARGRNVLEFDFRIYNEWGQLIFQNNNPAYGWDGTYKGQPLEPDTYLYILKVLLNNGIERILKGHVSLIR